jgi:hypothetical protein
VHAHLALLLHDLHDVDRGALPRLDAGLERLAPGRRLVRRTVWARLILASWGGTALPGSRSGLARPTDGARRRVDLHASEPAVLADQQLVEEPVRVDLQPAGDDLPAELLLGRGDGLRKANLGGCERRS